VGSKPNMWGSKPNKWGSKPKKWGSKPSKWGSKPEGIQVPQQEWQQANRVGTVSREKKGKAVG